MSLDIRLLGPVEILVDGSPIDVDTRKATALLAYLALTPGPLPRDSAALLLWPDASTDSARGSLRRTLSALRKGLAGRWIEADRHEIVLHLHDDIAVDVTRFEELGGAEDLDSLAAASMLYRGDFMAGFALRDAPEFDDWQMSQSSALRRLASELFDRLSVSFESHDMMGDAVDAAGKWLALDPLHEPAHRRLMALYAKSGDRNAAVRQYRECVRVFEEELGVPPLDETTELYRRIVEGDGATVSAAAPPAPQIRAALPGFVGRDADLAKVDSAYQASREGIVTTVVIGEPGIGKTRFVEEFLAAHPTAAVLRVTGHPAERSLPYGIVVEMVRSGMALPGAADRLRAVSEPWLVEVSRLVPEIGAMVEDLPEPSAIDGPGGHRRMLEGLARVVLGLVEGVYPGVIFVDDAHWCDPASVEVLALLSNRVHDEQGLLLLALRDDAVPEGHPVRDLRHDEVALSRLGVEEVGDLLSADSPGLAEQAEDLHRVSEGVPFILVEYLAAMDRGDDLGALPGGVRSLLQERLDGLTGVALQVAGAASIFQRAFGFDELRTVGGRTEGETLDGLEELVAASVVVDVDGEAFLFGHERLHQYVYESMNAVRRRLLHSRAADELMGPSSRTQDAAVTAGHLAAAGRTDEAAKHHFIAAEGAGALYANEDALGHYEAALALGHPAVARIRECMAELHALRGDYGRALAGFEAAAAGTDEGDLGRIEAKIANVHTRLGNWDLADAHYAAAIGALDDDPAERSRTLAAWASMTHRAGDADHASKLAWQALDDATLADDRLALAEAHNVLGIVQRSIDQDGARRHHEVALTLVDDSNPVTRAAALNNLALTYLAAGNAADGLEAATEALDLCLLVGDRHKVAAVHNNLADLYHAAGRDADAIDQLKAAATIFADVGSGGDELQPEIWMLSEW